MTELVYRIQRKSDGLFSTGTTKPSWTKQGKFFVRRRDVVKHLTWFLSGIYYADLEGNLTRLVNSERNPDDYLVNAYELKPLPAAETEHYK